jgi:indolepyruvate ferredoxin oxidoreductase
VKRYSALPTWGGEGANWIDIEPFVDTRHVFQNLGDGTYFHSGLMAIRATLASKSNITYKILYNDVVPMTGGQPIDGTISAASMAQQVLSEGAVRCVVVSVARGTSELFHATQKRCGAWTLAARHGLVLVT